MKNVNLWSYDDIQSLRHTMNMTHVPESLYDDIQSLRHTMNMTHVPESLKT